MSDELKPCLRCGAEDEDNNIIGTVVEDNEGGMNYWIICECGCAVGGDSVENAVRLWNTRPVEDALRAKWQSVPWAALHTAIWLMASYLPGSKEADYDALIAFVESNAPQEATE